MKESALTSSNRLGGAVISDRIVASLLEELRTGRYARADRLPAEVDLAAELGVSRTVIRDALSEMERAGYVTFDIGNFLHMTGFKLRKSGINARHFFNLCYDKRLTEADFDFSADGTTEMKMRVLPSLMKKNLSAKMLGDYNMSQPKLYTDKIAGSLSACMGFVRDGGEGRFVPNTVLEGDIRTKVKAADRIIATYRKSRSEEQYSEIVFTAKKVEWEKIVLPDEYSYLVLPE